MKPVVAISTAPQGKGLKRSIRTEAWVLPPGSPNPDLSSMSTRPLNALWDTGASGSVICQTISSSLSLVPVGVTTIVTANGERQTNSYLIDLLLPGGLHLTGMTVSESDFTHASSDFDLLIGMDVITLGDFLISNFNGNTMMNFRVPSQGDGDYVQKAKMLGVMANKRNPRRRK